MKISKKCRPFCDAHAFNLLMTSPEYTVEPRYNEVPWDHEHYLVISGFLIISG